ncbi:hypothetical protein AKJ16_DCAP16448 [Drosera capensis]
MGSSRSSLLGEATINLADYVTAFKPTVVTLPLQGSDAGADLNVTVQLLTSKTGFREFEQQRELSERRLQTASDHDAEKMLTPRDYSSSLIPKVNSRVKFKRETGELPLLGEASLNEEFPDLASGFDGMSNTSDSLYAEKNDMPSMHENDSIKSTMSGDFSGLSLAQSPNSGKRDSSASVSVTPGSSDWIQSWGTDPQMDNDVVNVYEENSRLHGSLEVAELSMQEMQLEVNTLQSYADGVGVETHKLTQELTSEIAYRQELAKEVSSLKSECEALKGELESSRSSGTLGGTNSSGNAVRVREESDDRLHQDGIRHQSDTSWTKGLIVLEDKIRELQNKAYLSFRGNEVQFLVSDLEALVGVVHDLGQEGSVPELAIKKSGSVDKQMMNENSVSEMGKFESGSGFGLDLCHPEDVLQCLSVPELVSRGANSSDNSADKHEELFKLLRELDESKAEKEALVTKMDQMECYYEALIQELEENQKRMLGEYQNIRSEHSGCIYTISSTKAQMEAMHQAMSEKILKLEKERCELESVNKDYLSLRNEHAGCLYTISSTKAQMEAMHQDMSSNILKHEQEKRELDSLNKELERRASTSETTLRRLRLNYSIAVNQLQKELETLSCQIVSMYETNENLVKKVFEEALKPCFEGYSEATWSENAVKRDLNILEDLRKSITSRKELHRENEEELYGICLAYSQLDVLGQILQQSLREATAEIIFGKESLRTLTELLEASTKSNESLKAELQMAANDISALTVDKAVCISKCYEMTQQNQILEEKFRGISDENRVLVLKAAEWEAVATENKSFKDRYEACDVDRQELASLCEQLMTENTNLSNRNFFLQEELSAMKNELGKLASSEESLQRAVDYMQEQLAALSASYRQQLAQVLDKSLAFPHLESDNVMGIFSWLGEVQDMSCKRIHQLMQEKRDLEDERNLAEFSLSSIKHEAEVVRQKYEHDVRNMVLRLDVSSTLVEKLEGGLQAIDDRLKQYTGAEAKYAMVFDELSSDYARMQAELQDLSIKNGDLLQQILSLGSITEELERSRLVLAEVTRDKEELTASLKDKAEESELLVSEVNNLKDAWKSLTDELLVEKGLRSSLESEVSELKSQLSKVHLKFHDIQQHAAEAVNTKQLLSKLEVESSTLLHQLSQAEERQRQTLAELERSNLIIAEVTRDKEELTTSLKGKADESVLLVAEVNNLKGALKSLSDELLVETGLRSSLEREISELKSQLSEEHLKFHDIQQNAAEAANTKQLLSKLEVESSTLLHQLSQAEECQQQTLAELERSKLVLAEVTRNKEELTTFLKDKVEGSNLLVAEVNTLKGVLKSLNDEFLVERGLRSSLECEVSVLNSQLKEEHLKLLEFQKHAAGFVHLKQLLSNLEVENSTLLHELSQVKECRTRTVAEMESRDTHESLLAADVALAFLTFQYKSHTEELLQQLGSRDGLLQDLDEKHLTSDTMPNHYVKENAQLFSTLESLKSELQISTAQKKALEDRYMEDKSVQDSEIKRLSFQLESCQEAIDSLSLSNQESEIKLIVLKLKLDEHCNFMNQEFMSLEQQNNELNHRLHEQTLKMEEFRNLSIHLKELKDQAETDFLQLRQKRDTEGAKHESLRIAFIKEQYEGKLQGLRQQISISKKHGEEMLCKLQDAVDQLEKTKKSEASQIKRNEELAQIISALEEDLNSALSDVREKANAYDQVKAELECSLISLECCKEEKQQLVGCLQECNEEKRKLEAEFSSMRETLESSMASTKPVLETKCEPYGGENCSAEQVEPAFLESESRISTGREASVMTSVNDSPSNGFRDCPKCRGLQEPLAGNCISGFVDARIMTRSPPSEGALECRDVRDTLESRVNGEDTLENDAGHADNQLTASSLRSRINKLHSELERMKVENTANGDDHIHPFGPKTDEGIESEMAQLEKVNKELGSISPAFNDFSENSNPIERVLALELELADALQAKRKSSILFQSSFLKQFGDEAAVLRSFRDINELIKNMLEMKARYSTMDRELTEMHDRYSELSLQYAEVEGERQKLMIMLKNSSRASKRLLSRSSSASLPES